MDKQAPSLWRSAALQVTARLAREGVAQATVKHLMDIIDMADEKSLRAAEEATQKAYETVRDMETRMRRAEEYAQDLEKKIHDYAPRCVVCASVCPPERWSYAHPTCSRCLPAPEPLKET